MQDKKLKLREILREARRYRESLGRPVTYSEYENFKQKLYDNDLYGYEGRLSNVLGV